MSRLIPPKISSTVLKWFNATFSTLIGLQFSISIDPAQFNRIENYVTGTDICTTHFFKLVYTFSCDRSFFRITEHLQDDGDDFVKCRMDRYFDMLIHFRTRVTVGYICTRTIYTLNVWYEFYDTPDRQCFSCAKSYFILIFSQHCMRYGQMCTIFFLRDCGIKIPGIFRENCKNR